MTVNFDILYDCENFAVINKNAGIAVQQWTNVPYEKSLECKLKNYFHQKNEKVFLVHRLDKDTSGCLIIAKNLSAKEIFEKMFREGDVKKEYLTLVKGIVKNKKGTIKIPLQGRGNSLVNALTFYEVKKTFSKENISLVKVKIKTGRKHQIRQHFAKMHHPVVMDKIYGDFKFNKNFEKTYKLHRQFLHAQNISFDFKDKKYNFTAPLPIDIGKII